MKSIRLIDLYLDDFKEIIGSCIKEELLLYKEQPLDQLYSRKELAKKLGISLASLSYYTKQGLIISRKIGHRIFYSWEDVLKSAIKVEPCKIKRNHEKTT